MNVAVAFFTLIAVALLYIIGEMIYECCYNYDDEWSNLPSWLKWFILLSFGPCCITYACTIYQAYMHISMIKLQVSENWHDKVFQIVMMPIVFSTLSLSCLVRTFSLIGGSATTFEEELAIAKATTDLSVAAVYESWALFQFGRLILALISRNVERKQQSEDVSVRIGAEALAHANHAVTNLAWIGLTIFLIVCVAQSGYDIYLTYAFSSSEDWYSYSVGRDYFVAAGWVASAAAIWNITVMERTFGEILEGFVSRTKFVGMKILISMAFFQSGVLEILQWITSVLPDSWQTEIDKCPVLGDILAFSTPKTMLFYSALFIWECFIIGMINFCAWTSEEEWYHYDKEPERMLSDESSSLSSVDSSSYGS